MGEATCKAQRNPRVQQILVVGLGGLVGAIARYVLTGLVQRRIFPGLFPAGTLVVNSLGCLLIGILMALATQKRWLSPDAQLLLVTGVLGSLTTFSTFGYETVELLRQSQWRLAVLNVAANIVIGFAAVWIGHSLTRLAVS